MRRSLSGSSLQAFSTDRMIAQLDAPPSLHQEPSKNLLGDSRPTTNAFKLARPGYMSTYNEHSWHGGRKPLGLPRLHSANPSFQASFSVSAFKSGSLKPSTWDTLADNTVTKFADAQPTPIQMELAQAGYKNMQHDWAKHVRSMNELQLTPISMRNVWRNHPY